MKNEKEIKIEKEKDIKEDIKENKKTDKKWDIFYFFFFSIIAIYSIIVTQTLDSQIIDLGDFGSILPLIFNMVYVTGFSWLPIFSLAGIISVIFKKYFGDMSKVLMIIVGLVCVVSTIIMVCV